MEVTFPPTERPVVLGIEGAVHFVRSTDSAGQLVLDGIVEPPTDSLTIPAGEQTLVVYYRTCSGSCSILDPPTTFCAVELNAEPGATYQLTVQVVDEDRATCTLDRQASG